MLSNYFKKVHSWCLENKNDLYIAALILFVSLASFGLGRLSILWPKKESIKITNGQLPISNDNRTEQKFNKPASIISAAEGKYVASKSGTAYHYPWCPGALKIKEENKIFFNTKEEAENKRYKPAGNCPGL